jgi:hypothetical protein
MGSRVQRFRVQRFWIQDSKVQRFKGSGLDVGSWTFDV